MRLQDGTVHARLQRGPAERWSGREAAAGGGAAVCAGVTGALGCAERPLPAVTSPVPGARLGAGSCPGGIFGAAHLGGLRDTFPPGPPGQGQRRLGQQRSPWAAPG